jgi:hypothetical protein
LVAGKHYFYASAVADEEEARRCQKALKAFFDYLGSFVVSYAIPYLGWLDLGGHEKAMKKAAKELDSIFGEWLEEHKRKRAAGEAKVEQDFMDVLLSVLDGKDIAGYDADSINKATCLVRNVHFFSFKLMTEISIVLFITVIIWYLSLIYRYFCQINQIQT